MIFRYFDSIWNKIKTACLSFPEAGIIAAGIILRLKHLAENRPLWLDESYVAVNITSRTYFEILSNHEILPEFARQPMFFSLIEKLFVSLFGNNEIALRLFPFLAGSGAFLLFAVVTRTMLTRRAHLIALLLFALAEPLVYYSAELKQYSVDLFCAISLIAGTRAILMHNFKLTYCLILAITGALILWLSNAMVFVLGSVAVVILFNKPWRWGGRVTGLMVMTAILWAASFFLLYYFSLRFMVGKSSITDTWQGAFCSSPLVSFETLRWAWNVLTLSFSNPVGLKWWWLVLPCFLVGARVLWLKERNLLLLWLLPIVLTFLAALLGKYPFYERVLLFLTAGYYLFIAAGIDHILQNKVFADYKGASGLILALLVYQPLFDSGYALVHSRSKTDNRAPMEFLSEYYKPGDYIYLSTLAQEPFWYYAAQIGLSSQFPLPVIGILNGEFIRGMKVSKFALDPKEIAGKECLFFRSEYLIFNQAGYFRASMGSQRDNERVSLVPLDQIYPYPPTGRTWLFVSGPSALEAGVNALIVGSFDKRAKRLLSLDAHNAGIYLYDMR